MIDREPTQAKRERQLWLDQGLKKLRDEIEQQRHSEEAMSTPVQHTAIPWKVKEIGRYVYIEEVTPTEIDCIVCDLRAVRSNTPKERARILATAEFIVCACNVHKELLEALQEVRDMSQRWMEDKDPYMGDALTALRYKQVADRAIARAEGE